MQARHRADSMECGLHSLLLHGSQGPAQPRRLSSVAVTISRHELENSSALPGIFWMNGSALSLLQSRMSSSSQWAFPSLLLSGFPSATFPPGPACSVTHARV